MAEPKWTPGPWQVCNTYHAVHGERVRNIALCGNAHIPQGNGRILVPDDEAKANAHLIAAAPDLYEACEKARNVQVRRCRSVEHTSELQSRENLVCRLLVEKNKLRTYSRYTW